MPRKKKVEVSTEKNDNDNDKPREDGRFVYCGLLRCPHTECLRHNSNAPFGILILQDTFNPDKEWNCKNIVLE